VAREDDRDSCVRPFAEHARHHVERRPDRAGERLVEYEDFRTEDQRGGELDALLVAEAERLEFIVALSLRPKRSSQRTTEALASAPVMP